MWENYEKASSETISGGTGIVINKIKNTYFILTNAHVVLEKYCFGEAGCQDLEFDDSISIVIDHPDTQFEYRISNSSYVWWSDYDLAVIKLDLEDKEVFSPIAVGGKWHPLMNVYGAGFPVIYGNYNKYYTDMVFCNGVVNTMFSDAEALSQLSNYSIAHSYTLAGGMSGGPLVDKDGKLLGINGLGILAEIGPDYMIDISESLFNYAIDIWDIYMLEIVSSEEEEGHFNSDSIFFNYLPKLSHDYHSDFYDSYVKNFPEHYDRINQLFE